VEGHLFVCINIQSIQNIYQETYHGLETYHRLHFYLSRQIIEIGEGIDWAVGATFAFAIL
jgi:hypothetical protein